METLLTPSGIKLYGRVMSSLQYYDDTSTIGNNNFLQHQLSFAKPTGLSSPAMPVNGTISSGDVRKVVLPGTLGNINIGMVVTGIYPAGSQAFTPGTHIIYVTKDTPPAGVNPAVPASFVISTDPLALPPANAAIAVPLVGN
jgi:hypothetical protein